MLELGIGADIVRGIGLLIWLAFFACLAFALWIGKNRRNKVMGAVLVTLLFIAPAAPGIYRAAVYKHNYAKAKVLFDERCKVAGEKVTRRVDGVDGVLLLKVRPSHSNADNFDPMYPGAALFDERGGDEYIATFLRYGYIDPNHPEIRGQLSDEPTPRPGYRFVDVVDITDGKRYRYTADFVKEPYRYAMKLSRTLAPLDQARFGVTYDDIIDSADRKYWVAGTVLKVIDTQTSEVIAEQTRYLFDSGLGSTAGARSPWSWAATYVPGCPTAAWSGSATRHFVEQVLKTTKGE